MVVSWIPIGWLSSATITSDEGFVIKESKAVVGTGTYPQVFKHVPLQHSALGSCGSHHGKVRAALLC